MPQELTCIRCPLGCNLQVYLENGKVVKVDGNGCRLGADYAEKESVFPTRTITSTITVLNGTIAMLPVKTDGEVPKAKIMDCMKVIQTCCVKAPIQVGDVVIADTAGTGVDVVATRNIKEKTQLQ